MRSTTVIEFLNFQRLQNRTYAFDGIFHGENAIFLHFGGNLVCLCPDSQNVTSKKLDHIAIRYSPL